MQIGNSLSTQNVQSKRIENFNALRLKLLYYVWSFQNLSLIHIYDILSVHMARLVEADALFILTSVDGL